MGDSEGTLQICESCVCSWWSPEIAWPYNPNPQEGHCVSQDYPSALDLLVHLPVASLHPNFPSAPGFSPLLKRVRRDYIQRSRMPKTVGAQGEVFTGLHVLSPKKMKLLSVKGLCVR